MSDDEELSNEAVRAQALALAQSELMLATLTAGSLEDLREQIAARVMITGAWMDIYTRVGNQGEGVIDHAFQVIKESYEKKPR